MSIKKAILTVVLLCLSAVAAYYVKDLLDRQNPDNARPRIEVTADGRDVPVTVSGYHWDFISGGSYEKTPPSVYDIAPVPHTLLGGEVIDISFSQPVKEITVRRSASYSYDFTQEADVITVPFENGGYIYEVRAEFSKGWMLCYFYIIVHNSQDAADAGAAG